ncbi:hypothetical protein FRC11_003438 [Ceratobasidium sp. 423]|nr:hypothetical protein FRC11_003438 [Ceratobasidium sp. 423]
MSNPDQAEYEDVADAFKSLKVSSRARVAASEDEKSKEKALPPVPPPRTPYQPRYPAHRQPSEDALPISLRPNIPSSTIYPPPISMPTPHAGYLHRDPLVTNPLPRPPALHPALAGSASPVTPLRTSNPYAPPPRVSMPQPDVPSLDLSMPEAILDPSSPPSRVPWPPAPPITPYRPSNDPYLNGFSTPQPPRPDPVSPPPKGGSDKPARPRAASVPPTATAPDTQCSAITKAGKRCTRQVKSGPALVYQSPGVLLDRFCFQHTKDVLQPTGFYSHAKVDTWVIFAGASNEPWVMPF